jgi:3',5'-cyclic AMP phosphodiesterase CpdA
MIDRMDVLWRVVRGGTLVLASAAVLLVMGCGREQKAPEATASASRETYVPAPDDPSATAAVGSSAPDRRFERAANGCLARERVTFLVTSDPHFGASPEIDQRNVKAIAQMNAMSGKPWPAPMRGEVEPPCGVLVLGDLTELGQPEQWQSFERAFGLRGHDGLLAFPVFETLGNHDGAGGLFVRDRIRERHGSTAYAWRWGKLHLALLGAGPDDEDLAWLGRELGAVAAEEGIVVGLHYPMQGPFSQGQWFGDGPYRQRLRDVLQGHRVLALFHGHYHAAGLYAWRGLRVFRPGSPKHSWHTFDVVESDGTSIRVGCWDYDQLRWRYGYQSASATSGEVQWADEEIVP